MSMAEPQGTERFMVVWRAFVAVSIILFAPRIWWTDTGLAFKVLVTILFLNAALDEALWVVQWRTAYWDRKLTEAIRNRL